MMTPLRDLTEGPRALPVQVSWSPVYEVLTSLWSLADKQHFADNDLGHEFYDTHISRMHPDQRLRFDRLSRASGIVWLSLFGPAADLEDLSPDAFLDALTSLEDRALRRTILGYVERDRPELAEAAADGDADVIEQLLTEMRERKPEKQEFTEGLQSLLAEPPGAIRDDAVEFLRFAFDELFEEHLTRCADALRRDAEATETMALTMSPERLIELATKGISYTPQPGVVGYHLIPSLVVRPWALMLEHEGVRFFVYPVGDEHLDADPDTPPSWMLSVYKALADEKRLRVLHTLAQGPAGLGDLAAHIGVAKSTMHHHLGILRQAGLIRVAVGDLKEPSAYSLRPEVLPELDRVLATYLRPQGKDTA